MEYTELKNFHHFNEGEALSQGESLPLDGVPAIVSIVAPCFNDAACIQPFIKAVSNVFSGLSAYRAEFVFVDDGSTDDTLQNLLECKKKYPIIIIELSRNFGKEAALSAGLEAASGSAVIPMDVDLQDPPALIPQMLRKWREGYDVVLAHRENRDTDSFLKRLSAHLFYRVHNHFAEQHLPENVGDFRLMDRKVVDALALLPESNRFMKGLFAWLGFRTATIDYVRSARIAGKSKFRYWKLWNFALDGLTSFSTVYLRIWTYIGCFFAFLAFIYGNIIFWRTIFFGVDLPGYASLLVAIVFFGGLQLIGIGVIGEYLGRTYIEAKRRPTYLIRHIYK